MERERTIGERLDDGLGMSVMAVVIATMYLVPVALTATAFFFIARAIIRGLLS